MDKVQKQMGLIALVISLIAPLVTVAFGYGVLNTVIKNNTQRIEQLEGQKGSETKLLVELHTKQIDQIGETIRKTDERLNVMDKNLGVIAEWVKEQRDKGK